MAHNDSSTRVVAERNGLLPFTPRTGLLLVALPLALSVAAAGTAFSVAGIEQHLRAETRADLESAGVNPSTLAYDFDHRDVAIRGQLPAGVSVDDVRAALAGTDARALDLDGLVDGQPVDPAPPAAPEGSADDTVATTTADAIASPDDVPATDEPVTTAAPATTTPVTATPAPTTTAAPEPTDTAAPDPATAEASALQVELDALTELIRTEVVFSASSDDLDQRARTALDAVVTLLEQYPLAVLQVTGHTDDRGSDDTNLKLSASRAESVANYLVSQGIASDRIRSAGAGESQPIADNATSQGQAANRRVQFTALGAFT